MPKIIALLFEQMKDSACIEWKYLKQILYKDVTYLTSYSIAIMYN